MFGKKKKPEDIDEQSRIFRDAFFHRGRGDTLPESRRREPFIRPSTFLVASLWTLFFGVSAYAGFVAPFHRVVDVSVFGSEKIGDESLKEFVMDELSGKKFSFIRSDNFFLVSAERIRGRLLEAYPVLSSVEVAKRFPATLSIRVFERDRIMLWCVSGECALVGDDGRAGNADSAEREENARWVFRVEESAGSEISNDVRIIDPELRSKIFALEWGIRERAGVPIKPTLRTPSRISREFRFESEAGWEIITNANIDPGKTISTLALVLKKEIGQDRIGNLKYIDLRTENRAYYAFVSDEAIEEGKRDEQTSE